MKIVGCKKDDVIKEMAWSYQGDNKLVGKINRKLKEKPKISISLSKTNERVKYIKDNCYYEICDLESKLNLPIKTGSAILNRNFLGKDDYIVIKFTTEDNNAYRIELYDPLKSTMEFGAPLYVFTFYPHEIGKYMNTGWYSNNKDNDNYRMFLLSLKYIMARHYDIAINRILYTKNISSGEFCINENNNKIENIINEEVFSLDINVLNLLISFIARTNQHHKENPRQSVGMFGNFNMGLTALQGDYLILRLDNNTSVLSNFIGKLHNGLKRNAPLKQFTLVHSRKDE